MEQLSARGPARAPVRRGWKRLIPCRQASCHASGIGGHRRWGCTLVTQATDELAGNTVRGCGLPVRSSGQAGEGIEFQLVAKGETWCDQVKDVASRGPGRRKQRQPFSHPSPPAGGRQERAIRSLDRGAQTAPPLPSARGPPSPSPSSKRFLPSPKGTTPGRHRRPLPGRRPRTSLGAGRRTLISWHVVVWLMPGKGDNHRGRNARNHDRPPLDPCVHSVQVQDLTTRLRRRSGGSRAPSGQQMVSMCPHGVRARRPSTCSAEPEHGSWAGTDGARHGPTARPAAWGPSRCERSRLR